MTREELREKVARAMAATHGHKPDVLTYREADAAIALVLEEAAKECMTDLPGEGGPMEDGYRLACEENARNIRAMKGMRDE